MGKYPAVKRSDKSKWYGSIIWRLEKQIDCIQQSNLKTKDIAKRNKKIAQHSRIAMSLVRKITAAYENKEDLTQFFKPIFRVIAKDQNVLTAF